MTDTRTLVFPMTAGDVVVSVQIVSVVKLGGKPELVLLEVVDVRDAAEKGHRSRGSDDVLTLVVLDPLGVESELELKRETPLLLTGISRR